MQESVLKRNSLSCAQRKQAGSSSESRPPTPSVLDESSPSHATRSATEPYNAKECCVICGKKWFRVKDHIVKLLLTTFKRQ